jgi:hypothetical protein
MLENLTEEYGLGVIFLMGAGFILGLLLYFFYLKNLYDLLKTIREPNRKMPPGQVWLVLITFTSVFIALLQNLFYDMTNLLWFLVALTYAIKIFVLVWNFRMVTRIADSIEAEYDSRAIPMEHRPTYQTGMLMCVCSALTLLQGIPYLGFIGSIAAILYLIVFIMYWVRTWEFKKKLQALGQYQDEESIIFKDLH